MIQRILKFGCSLALVYLVVSSRGPAFGMMGYNYWPAGNQHDQCLTNYHWNTVGYKGRVEADMDHIASLGGGVIRIMFRPDISGWTLTQNGGGSLSSTYDQITANFLELLQMCQERDIKVIVTFNARFWRGTTYNGAELGTNPWKWAYGDDSTGWNNFRAATCEWINGFVDTIEESLYADTILYYDYANEWTHYGSYDSTGYITYLYDNSSIPAGKRGVSVLYANNDNNNSRDDVVSLKNALGTRTLNYVDFHSYPESGHQPNIESDYDFVKSYFPSPVTVILGEFSRSAFNPPPATDEATAQTTILDLINRARTKGISYFLHWQLWDVSFGWGLGYGSNDAKHAMGGLSTISNQILLQNGDMETASGSQPANWTLGYTGVPSQNIVFVRQGPSLTGASSNSYYGRIKVDATSTGTVWMESSAMTVPTGTGSAKIAFTNGFVRFSAPHLTNVHLEVREFNSGGTQIAVQSGPNITTYPGWIWSNYLQHSQVGSWNATLDSSTATIKVRVVGDVNVTSGSGYLDVDTLSSQIRIIP